MQVIRRGNAFIINFQKAFVYEYGNGMKGFVYGKAFVFEFVAGINSLAFLFGFHRVLKRKEEFSGPRILMKMPRTRNRRSTIGLLTLIMEFP